MAYRCCDRDSASSLRISLSAVIVSAKFVARGSWPFSFSQIPYAMTSRIFRSPADFHNLGLWYLLVRRLARNCSFCKESFFHPSSSLLMGLALQSYEYQCSSKSFSKIEYGWGIFEVRVRLVCRAYRPICRNTIGRKDSEAKINSKCIYFC